MDYLIDVTNIRLTHMQSQRESVKEVAALKIQRLWRSYTNRKIYKYYRDIIFFKCKGNPAKLLKGINPLQAMLLEAASKAHIRFRLGGQNFPPNIYYKIFTKNSVVDINAFAPRDYAALPRNKPTDKISLQDYKSRKEQYEEEGWYLRADNNGWRPISHKMFDKSDYIELYSANKVRYYHHKKQKRLEKCAKKARIAKLRWLQGLYKQAKEKEAQKESLEGHDAVDLENQIAKAKDQLGQYDQQELENEIKAYNPLDNPKLIEIEDQDEFQRQVQQIVDWSQNLDYDTYARQWFQLSTSQSSSKFAPTNINATAAVLQEDKPPEPQQIQKTS